MRNARLSMACWQYDRTRALISGEIKPSGIDLDIKVLPPLHSFSRMERGEFQASELSLASYATLVGRGASPFVGIPIPLSKMFRHSCIYVRADAGIQTPQDLKGRRVGSVKYGSTGMVWIRGLLSDEYGVLPKDMHWFIGGVSGPIDFAPYGVSADLDNVVTIEDVPPDETLQTMLLQGALDALFLLDIPPLFMAQSPPIARLFPDFKRIEIDYYRRTGIFPIMHTVVIRRDVFGRSPWMAQSLFDAFSTARDAALDEIYDTDALKLSLPWLIDHIEESRSVFGKDFWSYGIEPNRKAYDAIGRYVFEQGLSPRPVAPAELYSDYIAQTKT